MRAHGSYVKYVQDHCRCQDCRNANRDYERQRKKRTAPPYVGADRARQHLAELAAAGVGMKTVAARSGVSHGCLWKLVYGLPGRGPSKRIRPDTEAKILAVTPADVADGGRVDAAPTWAIVEQLLARGWTKMGIAVAIGQKGPGLQLSRRSVSGANARAVRSLLDQPIPERRDSHGNVRTLPEPEPVELPMGARDDIDLLYLDMIEVLEARREQPWRKRAACRITPGAETRIFFPNRGDHQTVDAAKRVCASCPVAAECRAAASERAEALGVWGGVTARTLQRDRASA